MAASNTTAQQMLAAMLNKPLYVALRQPANLARMGELLQSHLEWAIAAERRGVLFASGPFVAEGAAPGSTGGMSILRAGSVEEALSLLAEDPFINEGVFTVEVRKWLLMEGGVTLTVRFSDQTGRLM